MTNGLPVESVDFIDLFSASSSFFLSFFFFLCWMSLDMADDGAVSYTIPLLGESIPRRHLGPVFALSIRLAIVICKLESSFLHRPRLFHGRATRKAPTRIVAAHVALSLTDQGCSTRQEPSP